jgi:hypothetical protein
MGAVSSEVMLHFLFRSIDEAIFVEPDYFDVQLASTAFYDVASLRNVLCTSGYRL